MNLDDLKNAWNEKHRELADRCINDLASHVLARVSFFEHRILRRDLVETAAAILVILVFAYFALRGDYPWIATLGVVLIILGATEIVAVLHWARRSGGQRSRDLPLTEYYAAELARVDRQIRLLRSVNWWYIGPLLAGVCVFVFGLLFPLPELPLHISAPAFAVFCLLVLIFGWMIYRTNQQAVSRELVPLREELSAICKSLLDDPPRTSDSQ